MRQNSTSAEQLLWKALQRKQVDWRKFRRQHSIGGFILDFYCPSERLGIELGGAVHNYDEIRESDRAKEVYLAQLGIGLLRFINEDVETSLIFTSHLG